MAANVGGVVSIRSLTTVPVAPTISRDNLLVAIDEQLAGGITIVTVEGPEGIGKTSVMRQLASRHDGEQFSLFISSASRWAYNPGDMLAELCSQMEYALGVPRSANPDEIHFRRLLTNASRRARASGRPFYFILDGLDDIPLEDRATRDSLFALMPFGMSGFVFALSGFADSLPFARGARTHLKSLLVFGFTAEETERYLAGCGLTDVQLGELNKVTKGSPGHLATVRRLLETGKDPDSVIAELHRSLAALFELEWSGVGDSVQRRLLLAVLAYENRPYSVERLSAITTLSLESVQLELAGLSFLTYDSGQTIRFVSEPFRRFAESKLEGLRGHVTDLFIAYFLADPESEEALTHLPTFFASADKLTDLVAYLSPERFATLYRKSPSVKLVQQKAEQGIAAARRLDRNDDVMRFALQRSTIEQLADSEITTSEVRALTALNDFDGALALAEGVSRSEERFRLLVAIARARRENGNPVDSALVTRIRTVYSELEPGSLGRKLPDVAADLFHVIPDLAIDLISREGSEQSGENSMDWALARLSVSALIAKQDGETQSRARSLRDKIADPGARRLSTEAIVILGDMSANDVILESRRFESTGDRLYVLQHWMLANLRRQDAPEVLHEGLEVAIRGTGYSANARVFRELALCLPFVESVQTLQYYTIRLDGQRASIERIGPTEEYIRLQLLLARSEWRFDHAASRERCLAIYNSIAAVEDLPVRAASTARLVSALTQMDPLRELESDQLHSIAEQELEDCTVRLLAETAEQLDALRGVVEALARTRTDIALQLAGRLNTETRRDAAYSLIVETVASGGLSSVDPRVIEDAIEHIVNIDERDEAIEEWIIASARRAQPRDQGSLQPLIPFVARIVRPSRCVRVASALYAKIGRIGASDDDAARQSLAEVMRRAWVAINADWEKLEVGYGVVADIAAVDIRLAERFVHDLNELKSQLTLYNFEAGVAAFLGISLAIRAYAAMVRWATAVPADAHRIRSTIERASSQADQAVLWSQLALRHHSHGNRSECERVVIDHLVPIMITLEKADPFVYAQVCRQAAAAIYCGARGSLDARLGCLSSRDRDDAISEVISFLFTKTTPDDPYQLHPGAGFDIDYATATEAIKLAYQIDNDSLVYMRIVEIVDSVKSPAHGDNFKQGQRADLVLELEKLARSKFPAKRFIQHQGYSVASAAYINQIREKKERIDDAELVRRAENIPNLSDSAFVLAIVASTVRDERKRRTLLEKASSLIEGIPLLMDRIDRFESLSELVSTTDTALSKRFLQRALTLSLQGSGRSIEARRRSLVDQAYRIDNKFASSLIAATDDEPAKRKIEGRLALHRLRESMGAKKARRDSPTPKKPVDAARAAWMQLGELHAHRTPPIPTARTFEYMQLAAAQPVAHSYAIFAWAIENAIRIAVTQTDARSLVVSLFEACLRGAELAAYAASRPGTSIVPLERYQRATYADTSNILLRDGERGEALRRIQVWLRELRPPHLWVVDPYFTPADVNILQLIQDEVDRCQIVILTSKSAHKSVDAPYEDTYRAEWVRISAAQPPNVTIILAGTQPSGKFPAHDRWWLSNDGGLYFGTSLGGLGKRWSEIRYDSAERANEILAELAPLLEGRNVVFDGEPVKYSTLIL